jgi:hypothetical protein
MAPRMVIHMVARLCGRELAPQRFEPRQVPLRTAHQLRTAARTIGHRHMGIIPRRRIQPA